MNTRKMGALSALLFVAAAACSSNSATPPADTSPTETTPPADETSLVVDVVDNDFEPGELTVAVGETVTWEWVETSEPHNVVANEGEFNSGEPTAEAGTEFEHTFEAAGVFEYTCLVHGESMSGTITVDTDRSSGSAAG